MAKLYRVEIAYRFKSKRPGVLIGMTVEATTEEMAEEIALARVIKPFPKRVFLYSMMRELP